MLTYIYNSVWRQFATIVVKDYGQQQLLMWIYNYQQDYSKYLEYYVKHSFCSSVLAFRIYGLNYFASQLAFAVMVQYHVFHAPVRDKVTVTHQYILDIVS